ncbi:glycerate kinase [Pseudactinotalea terrae]|uniref:glycerate kinase n=1 Tax=Pseudactinotalea terrae TaxID=1743262 RepID=UPI0013914854|nr:glycerate kinase [Pseudactinotalea terrae]
MRVLMAPDRIDGGPAGPDPAMSAVDVAAHLARGWTSSRPADSIVVHPMSDGGAGFLEALTAVLGGEREAALARDPWGAQLPTEWLRVGETAYIETAPLLGDPQADDAARLAAEGSSDGVGDVVLAAVRAGVRRVVLGVGRVGTHDAGVGALRAVAGAAGDTPVGEVVRAAVEVLRGVEVLVAAAAREPLVGLSGAGAALAARPGIDAAAAQARELALAGIVARIEQAVPRRPSLLAQESADQVRGSRRPHAGAGGGVAFALAAAGARVLPGAAVVAVETGLAEAVEHADLVLTAATALDGGALDDGVPGAVGRVALAALIPAVAVAPTVMVSRRELSGTGLEAIYPLEDPSAPGRTTPSSDLRSALSQRASRVARTWSR